MFKLLRTIPFFSPKSQFQSFSSSSSSRAITPISSSPPPNLIINYLTNSLGFHKHEAAAISSQVPHFKSSTNSNSVINLLKDYGLTDTQIRNIISIRPTILTMKSDKTLEPKLKVFKELGLPGQDLVTLVKRNQEIFWKGLHTHIIPTVSHLRNLLGCDELVVKMINRSKWLVLPNKTVEAISENISLLKRYGFSEERILKFLVTNPEHMKQKPELVESKLRYLEEKLGISRDSLMFLYGLIAVMFRSEMQIEKNIRVFKGFGWSDDEIATLFKAQPFCLDKTEAYINDKLTFFMKDLTYTPSQLKSFTCFWTLSLEKRMKPRYYIWNILKEKELMKRKLSYTSLVLYPESKFIGFLKRFESDIPNLCETYLNSIKDSKAK